MSKEKVKLPKELIKIDNPDKKWHEHWHEKRNPLNIIHPFRCLIFGSPNTGKTTNIKNIILRANPIFKKIYVTL